MNKPDLTLEIVRRMAENRKALLDAVRGVDLRPALKTIMRSKNKRDRAFAKRAWAKLYGSAAPRSDATGKPPTDAPGPA